MMTVETASASKETESRTHETTAPETMLNDGYAGVAASGNLTYEAFAEPANAGVRTLALRRAQQTHGNGFVQRAIAGIQRRSAGPRYIQRQCSCGGTCPSCQGKHAEEEEGKLLQRQPEDSAAAGSFPGEMVVDAGIIPTDSASQSLAPPTRAFMESRLGGDFSDVRVHTDSRAGSSADTLQADAYTAGRDIYFAEGKYAPETPAGQRLLAHELTHTMQQDHGVTPMAVSRSGTVRVGDSQDPLEAEAERAADAVAGGESTSGHPQSSDSAPVVRRDLRSGAAAAWNATGGRLVRGAEGLLEDSLDSVRGWLERRAPELMAFLRGDPVELLKQKIGGALDGTFGGLFSRIQHEGLFTVLSKLVNGGMEALSGLAHSISSDPCGAMRTIVQGLIDFQKWMASTSWGLVQQGASIVAGFFSSLWNDFVSPAWDAVKKLAGSAWAWIEARATEFWDWIKPLRTGIASIWNKVKQIIGAAWDTSTDIFDWLKAKATAAWERLKAVIQPVLGPLKVIGGILLLLSPLGPILAIGALGYGLFQAARWLYNNWNHLEIVIKARAFLHEQIIPWIHSAVGTVTNALHQAVQWLQEKANNVRHALAQLAEALGANTFLRAAKTAIEFVRTKFNQFADWVSAGFREIAEKVAPILTKLRNFFQPIGVVLAKFAIAVSNPLVLPIYLGAIVWMILPDCIKPPIIDYILDLMVAAIRAVPNWGFFGEHWPTIKESIAKELEAKRRQNSAEEKIRFSNKIANMIAGPDLTGFSNLVGAAVQSPGEFEGQAEEELLGTDLTKPLDFERTPAALPEGNTAPALGSLPAADQAVLTKPHLQDDDLTVDEVARLELSPEFIASLQLREGEPVEFGRNNDPERSVQAIRRDLLGQSGGNASRGDSETSEQTEANEGDSDLQEQLDAMIASQSAMPCKKQQAPQNAEHQPVPEELKIGPLSRGLRAHYVWASLKQGIASWWNCNKSWLLPTLIVGLIAFIVLAVVTEGAALTVASEIMEVVGAILLGVAAVRAASYIAEYVVNAIGGKKTEAARSLARAMAIVAIELAFILIFNVGDIIKGFKQGFKGAARAAGRAVTRTVTRGVEAATKLGRAGARSVAGVARAVVENGKLVLRGAGRVVLANAVRSLEELATLLWQRTRASFFKIVRWGERIFLQGCVNPCTIFADGRIITTTLKGSRPQVGDIIELLDDPKKIGIVIGVFDTVPSSAAQAIMELSPAERRLLYQELAGLTSDAARRSRILGAAATGANARELRTALKSVGETFNPGDHAHHIIPSTHRLADEARKILLKAGIGINDARNGIFLSEAAHAGLHSSAYIQKITDLLRNAFKNGGASEVRSELLAIKAALRSGGGIDAILAL